MKTWFKKQKRLIFGPDIDEKALLVREFLGITEDEYVALRFEYACRFLEKLGLVGEEVYPVFRSSHLPSGKAVENQFVFYWHQSWLLREAGYADRLLKHYWSGGVDIVLDDKHYDISSAWHIYTMQIHSLNTILYDGDLRAVLEESIFHVLRHYYQPFNLTSV